MSKPSWRVVQELHADHMRKLVVSMINRFRGSATAEGLWTSDQYFNCSSVNELNLLEEDVIIDLCAKAFKTAYKEWDGHREFAPYFRQVFVTSVNYAARKERLHRYREVAVLDISSEDNHPYVDLVGDGKTYLQPAEEADLNDFISTLPDMSKTLVCAALNAHVELGVSASAGVQEIARALWPYVHKLGWTRRMYWKTFSLTRKMIKERANGKNALRSLSRQTAGFGTTP